MSVTKAVGHLPALGVELATLVVNARMLLYSAALPPHTACRCPKLRAALLTW